MPLVKDEETHLQVNHRRQNLTATSDDQQLLQNT